MPWIEWDVVAFTTIAGLIFVTLCVLLGAKLRADTLDSEFRIALATFYRWLVLGIFATFVATLGVGVVFLNLATAQRMEQIRASTEGFAQTLARELTEHGHERIGLQTPDDDPAYLRLDALMTEWIRFNPSIDSLYTMRKTGDGGNVFVMSPGTDYDRDGTIAGELEERDPIGTPYELDIPELEEAFRGKVTFQYYPTEDKWGTTYSLFCPVYDAQGRQEAILGIDYNVFAVNRELLPTRWMILSLLFIVVLVEYYLFWIAFHSRWRQAQDRQTQKNLETLASTDHLTKIYNRSRFEEFLSLEIERARRYARPISLILFDIDRYKSINDGFGHQVGDRVLVELAQLVSQVVRKNDLVARWGGDEFVVACPELPEDAVQAVVRKIAAAIAEFRFSVVETITCSFGIAVLGAEETSDALVKQADEELYRAKESGRHSYSFRGVPVRLG